MCVCVVFMLKKEILLILSDCVCCRELDDEVSADLGDDVRIRDT